MTIKEAIIKDISEMNTDMLSLLLDDDKSYMDVPKETFIEKLDSKFNILNSQGIHEFSRVLKGYCGGDCNNGCGGYTFVTTDNQVLDLIVEEEHGEIKDLYTCSKFVSEEEIADKSKIFISFSDDVKSDYTPTSSHQALHQQIEVFFNEFDTFKNDVTDIEDFCNWSRDIDAFYDTIGPLERLRLNFTDGIFKLMMANSYIQDLITLNAFAKKAMQEFDVLDVLNENELIEWVLKYEENELDYGDYEKVENWEQNNLILHAMSKSVVIDCSKYTKSLQFSYVYPKHYWELFEKYKISEEQFDIEKAKDKHFKYDLRTFLKFRER